MPMLTALGEADWLPEPVDEELIPSPRSQASCRPGREIEVGPNHRLAAAEQEVRADKRCRPWQRYASYQVQGGSTGIARTAAMAKNCRRLAIAKAAVAM